MRGQSDVESIEASLLLNDQLPFASPQGPVVVMGDANLDPMDGEGLREGITALLNHPRLQDPQPKGSHGRTEPGHAGDPAFDTAFFDKGVGGLRVDVVLPSRDIAVLQSAVMWPADSDPLSQVLKTASRHRPVWVDIDLP